MSKLNWVEFKSAHEEGLRTAAKGWYEALEDMDYCFFEQILWSVQRVVNDLLIRKEEYKDSEDANLIGYALDQWFCALDTLFWSDECKAYSQFTDHIADVNKSLWAYHDGGRKEAGYLEEGGDCVIRSIAIATGTDYGSIWNQIESISDKSPDLGVQQKIVRTYFEERGWGILDTAGQSVCSFVRDSQSQTLVVDAHFCGNGHLTAIKDGKVWDTWNPLGWRVLRAYYPPE